jgi:hypothetical protein
MNQREKLLAAGVGVVGVLFVGQWVWSSIQSGFDAKKAQIETLTKKKGDQDLEIQKGLVATQRINKVTPRSASKSRELARAEYDRWLIELATKVRLIDPTHTAMSSAESRDKDGFQSHKFQLRGNGTLAHVTHLLHEFYSKPFLHRINRLDLRPLGTQRDKNPDMLAIVLDCEVLSIPTAKEHQTPLKSDPSLVAKSLDDFNKTILYRNIFSPPNQAPSLAATRTVDAFQGLRVDYSVDAKDPDPNQTMRYAIEGEAPEGLTIDPSSGRIDWTGRDLGEYQFKVVATDSGLPSKSASQLVTIRVSPPPPPRIEPEKFDIASQAKLTGFLSGRQGTEAWVHSLVEGKTHKLRKGDELKLGEIKGKVIDVGANFIELETDGRKWTVGFEESIAEAFKRGLID